MAHDERLTPTTDARAKAGAWSGPAGATGPASDARPNGLL